MTIEKLARLIVADYYEGSPGDECYIIAVEREVRKLREEAVREDGRIFVRVEVEK